MEIESLMYLYLYDVGATLSLSRSFAHVPWLDLEVSISALESRAKRAKKDVDLTKFNQQRRVILRLRAMVRDATQGFSRIGRASLRDACFMTPYK